jgi:hypothetical protein
MFLASNLECEDNTITATGGEQIRESHIQPLWHVLILTLLTAGLYLPFWVYKNCRDLSWRASASAEDSPEALKPLTIYEAGALRYIKRCYPIFLAFGAFLPYVGAFISAFYFKTIAQLYPEVDSPIHRYPILFGIILTLAVYGAAALNCLPGVAYLLYLSVVLPALLAQHWLNRYWRAVEPEGMFIRYSFSATELVLLMIGIMLTGMLILHFYFDV